MYIVGSSTATLKLNLPKSLYHHPCNYEKWDIWTEFPYWAAACTLTGMTALKLGLLSLELASAII